MLADYLAAESLIVERLRDQVQDLRAVLSAADLAGVEERSQVTPALHVLYYGDRLGATQGHNAGQIVYQQWLVVVSVRNARGQVSGQAARSDAGPIMAQVIGAMLGWQPSVDFRPFGRVTAPRPSYRPGGYAYFPLAFEAQIMTAGAG